MVLRAEMLRIEVDPKMGKIDSDHMVLVERLLETVDFSTTSPRFLEINRVGNNVLRVVLICKELSSANIRKLFLEFLELNLIPGSQLLILSTLFFYFRLPDVSDEDFSYLQVNLSFSLETELSEAIDNFEQRVKYPFLLGLESPDFMKSIIELSFGDRDEKVMKIQHQLAHILKRFPSWKKSGTIPFLRNSLCCMEKQFIFLREVNHLAKAILWIYFIDRKLQREGIKNKALRHIRFRLMPSVLNYGFGKKTVLSICFGVTLFNEKEAFQNHVIEKIISQKLPALSLVSNSYFFPPNQHERRRVSYFEIERKDGKGITSEDVKLIKRIFFQELKFSIPSLIPSLKISKNEEEIMKMILHLSNEATSIKDIPQVSINYDHHDENLISFRVLIINIEPMGEESLFSKIANLAMVHVEPEREQIIRYMEDGTIKKVYVFRVMLRDAQTIDKKNSSGFLYFSRQKIVRFIRNSIGDFRDYNGGMIEKQKEYFDLFSHSFQGLNQDYSLLIENYFFSLNPIEAQVSNYFDDLRSLFALLITIYNQPTSGDLVYKRGETESVFFIVFKIQDSPQSQKLIKKLNISNKKNIFSSFIIDQISYFSLLSFQNKERVDQIESILKKYKDEVNSEQTLRLSFEDLPFSLDPRLGGDDVSSVFGKMLFEGLFRLNPKGVPDMAIAKTFKFFDGNKRVVFELKNTSWSNGSPLIAEDFEYAWKSILNPNFSTPFDYFFYPIKNSKKAKERELPIDSIGVKALSEKTLLIDLEFPLPNLLNLLSHPLFSPINYRIDLLQPNWSTEDSNQFLCNGPFIIESRSFEEFCLKRNEHYWDSKSVKLKSIIINRADALLAKELFIRNQIDWLGRPIYPWYSSFGDTIEKKHTYSMPTVYWFVFNTKRFPFNCEEIRQAFSYAINQREIIDNLAFDGEPAYTPLPKKHSLLRHSVVSRYSLVKAQELFKRGLKKLNLTVNSFPTLRFATVNSSIRMSIAKEISKQLTSTFGINISVEPNEWPDHFRNMCDGNFQIGGISWHTWIDDPLYTLQAFKDGNQKTNFSKWENQEYSHLVDRAKIEPDFDKRTLFLRKAEEVLTEDAPIIPILHEHCQYVKKDHIKGDLITSLMGTVDFKFCEICKNS